VEGFLSPDPTRLMQSAVPPSPDLSVARGRLCIALAAVLWSTSGAFVKLLSRDTALGLNTPLPDPLQLAFYRVLFAGLVLLPALRRRDISFRPVMVVMAVSFAVMNALFVSAMAQGSAANAILLQYTAPMWLYLASVWLLRESADRRSSQALVIGLIGIAVIVRGGWNEGQLPIVGIALGSGVAYAGVLICLRVLRQASPRWLTVVNHLFGALALVPLLCLHALPSLRPVQFGVLILFGAVQMALPYWLVSRGLRVVSPQEAGIITLLEPVLNPLWAYLVVGEVPPEATRAGGAFILAALVWRYWPFKRMKDGEGMG